MTDCQLRFEREFFACGGSVLACSQELEDWTDGTLPDGGKYCKVGVFLGQLAYGAEMSLIARERKRQILGEVARRVFSRRNCG